MFYWKSQNGNKEHQILITTEKIIFLFDLFPLAIASHTVFSLLFSRQTGFTLKDLLAVIPTFLPSSDCMGLKRISHPELSQGVYVLGFEQCIIIAVHQALPMDHSSIVHQDSDVTHLQKKQITCDKRYLSSQISCYH